jgi:hypothetical protein
MLLSGVDGLRFMIVVWIVEMGHLLLCASRVGDSLVGVDMCGSGFSLSGVMNEECSIAGLCYTVVGSGGGASAGEYWIHIRVVFVLEEKEVSPGINGTMRL